MFLQAFKLCFKIKSVTQVTDCNVCMCIYIHTYLSISISESFLVPASEFMLY